MGERAFPGLRLPGRCRTCYDGFDMKRIAPYFFFFRFLTPQAVGRK